MSTTIRSRILSSSLLSKNLKIKIYRTLILPVVLYGCETWPLTVREECRLRGREVFLGLLTLEDGTDRLSRNVGTELPLSRELVS
jgi:hypothetical protein